MNIFTVSFFGHRYIENYSEIEKRLDNLIHDLIIQKEYVEFLVGREGEFDIIASSAIKRAVSKLDYGNTSFVLVLPYMKADYKNNEKYYLDYYDEVEICSESAEAHYKSAIQVRNRNIVDRSDLVVCCIQHNSGGAYQTIRYAKKLSRKIINLADDNLFL